MNTTHQTHNEEKRNQNKNEDKKALPKLIILTILSGISGGVFAIVGVRVMEYLKNQSDIGLVEHLQRAQLSLTPFAGYATFISAVSLSILGFAIFYHYKKIAKKLDLDDEVCREKIDTGLNISLFITSLNTIFSWTFFGIAFYCLALKDDVNFTPVALSLVSFIISTICTSLNQQKIINFTKELNPEKNGSVYDFNFQQKWMNSCDEAERFYIYKCSFVSFKATQITCIVLLVIITLLGMIFPIGILPLICICIIWGVSNIVYNITAMKVEKMSEN